MAAAVNAPADIQLANFKPPNIYINTKIIQSDLEMSIKYMTTMQKEGLQHAEEQEHYPKKGIYQMQMQYGLYHTKYIEFNMQKIGKMLKENNSLDNLCIYFITYIHSRERAGKDNIPNTNYTKVEKLYKWELHIVYVNDNKITRHTTLKLIAARKKGETPIYLANYTLIMLVVEPTGWFSTKLTKLQDYILQEQNKTKTPYIMYKGNNIEMPTMPNKGGYNHKVHTYRKKSKHTRRNTRRNTKRHRK